MGPFYRRPVRRRAGAGGSPQQEAHRQKSGGAQGPLPPVAFEKLLIRGNPQKRWRDVLGGSEILGCCGRRRKSPRRRLGGRAAHHRPCRRPGHLRDHHFPLRVRRADHDRRRRETSVIAGVARARFADGLMGDTGTTSAGALSRYPKVTGKRNHAMYST